MTRLAISILLVASLARCSAAQHQPPVTDTFLGHEKLEHASELFEEDKFDEAATAYLEVVARGPKQEFADKALFNAGISYENAQRYGSAIKVYERLPARSVSPSPPA